MLESGIKIYAFGCGFGTLEFDLIGYSVNDTISLMFEYITDITNILSFNFHFHTTDSKYALQNVLSQQSHFFGIVFLQQCLILRL